VPELLATDELSSPYADAPPARFIQSDGKPVYALVGGLFRDTADGPDGPIQLLVAPGIWREFHPDFLPMLEFFRTPRTEQQAREWLTWAGAPRDGLDDLVETGLVVKVDSRSPSTALASLSGVAVIPQSTIGDVLPGQPGLVGVRRRPEDPDTYSVTVELARVLWGLVEPEDLPTAVGTVAEELGEDYPVVARRVLTPIPALLAHGYVRLEWLRAPGL